ncbi:hypothetical protein PR048_029907 [Dryococelus australis]|uniref:Uncharacterized protein n=1 Tax=Dryococelus australis TaxID=614101 RepID=A0ABQ9GA46_9NEOP|nr:hypothetical protein PR048_029907 [Dryococelus australis]
MTLSIRSIYTHPFDTVTVTTLYSLFQCHYSVKSCASVCGLGTENCVEVPSDERGRMIPEQLERLILERKTRGHVPFFVNATAGTTVLGAFDPIEPIADICHKYRLWLHVDVTPARYGRLSEGQRRGTLRVCVGASAWCLRVRSVFLWWRHMHATVLGSSVQTSIGRSFWWVWLQRSPPPNLSCGTNQPMPPRSPELAVCDSFLWGALKGQVYSINPRTLVELQTNSITAIDAIPQHVLARAFHNFWCRLHSCLELSDYSPATKANRVRFPAGSPPDFHMWELCRRKPLVGGFSRGCLFPPPLHSGAVLHTPRFTLNGCKSSMLRAILNSPLHFRYSLSHEFHALFQWLQRRLPVPCTMLTKTCSADCPTCPVQQQKIFRNANNYGHDYFRNCRKCTHVLETYCTHNSLHPLNTSMTKRIPTLSGSCPRLAIQFPDSILRSSVIVIAPVTDHRELGDCLGVCGAAIITDHASGLTVARLHRRGSKLDPRSDLRSILKTVSPFEFRAELEIEMKLISNRRNWRFEISIRDQLPLSTNIRVDPVSEIGSFDLGSGKMLVLPDIRDIPFHPPLHSGAAPYSPRFTLTGSQDIDVKSLSKTVHIRLPGVVACCYPGDIATLVSPALRAICHACARLHYIRGAAVAERLARSPPTKANRAQYPAGSPDFRKWESCRTMPLVGGFSRGYPVSPAPSFRLCSIFTSSPFIGFQDLAVKSHPNLFTHSISYSDQFNVLVPLLIQRSASVLKDVISAMLPIP